MCVSGITYRIVLVSKKCYIFLRWNWVIIKVLKLKVLKFLIKNCIKCWLEIFVGGVYEVLFFVEWFLVVYFFFNSRDIDKFFLF